MTTKSLKDFLSTSKVQRARFFKTLALGESFLPEFPRATPGKISKAFRHHEGRVRDVDVDHLGASFSGMFRQIRRGNGDETIVNPTPVPVGVLGVQRVSSSQEGNVLGEGRLLLNPNIVSPLVRIYRGCHL